MAEGLDDFPFDWIARDLRTGKCIPFLGAGASSFPRDMNAKPPSARALALELAEESRYPPFRIVRATTTPSDTAAEERRMRAKLDCENLMLVSSWVEHGYGDRRRLSEKLRAHLADKQNPLSPNALHKLLARIARDQPMAIITTNYDDLAEQALTKQKVPFDLFVVAIDRPAAEWRVQGAALFRRAGQDELKPVTCEQELLDYELDGEEVRLKRTVLAKIHGHIGRDHATDDTFVITEEDYVSFLGRMGSANSVIPADLVNLMQSRTLLFLGYGLRDWNFRVLLDRLNGLRLRPMKSYAIAHDIDAAESRLWEKRFVEIFNADLNEFVPRLDAELAQATPPTT
jgi:hypothetical protein